LNDLKVTAMNQERILEMISEFQTLKKKEAEKPKSQKDEHNMTLNLS